MGIPRSARRRGGSLVSKCRAVEGEIVAAQDLGRVGVIRSATGRTSGQAIARRAAAASALGATLRGVLRVEEELPRQVGLDDVPVHDRDAPDAGAPPIPPAAPTATPTTIETPDPPLPSSPIPGKRMEREYRPVPLTPVRPPAACARA
jgi:hypothetical protein